MVSGLVPKSLPSALNGSVAALIKKIKAALIDIVRAAFLETDVFITPAN